MKKRQRSYEIIDLGIKVNFNSFSTGIDYIYNFSNKNDRRK